MSAIIELFPTGGRASMRSSDAASRYVRRAQDAFELLAQANSDLERRTLCDIAEIWLDLAESALPAKV
jgi:hypothetical protein